MARGSLSCKLNHATTAICLVMALLICWQGVESTCTGNESPCVNETDPPKPLFIAFFTSFGGAYESSGAIPAVDLALDLINNKSKPVARSNILPGFHLNYTRVYDIICERTSSYQNFFKMIEDAPPYPVAALGMGCAVASEPVAQINFFWNFPLMGYVAAAPSLSDRSRLQSYYRTYPSDAIFVPGIIAVIKFYGWRELCLITEEANTFMMNDRILREKLPQLGVNISKDSFPFDLNTDATDRIKGLVMDRTPDPHVFFINTFEEQARALLCEFYMLNITYPNYLFITHGWYRRNWWNSTVANLTIPCSDEEMRKALQGNIALQQFPKPYDPNAQTDAGITANEFEEMYKERLNSPTYSHLDPQFEAPDAFDAVWALGLALENASRSLCSGDLGHCANSNESQNVPLHCYEFFNSRIECLVNRSLNNLKFEGVSGTVQFDEHGARIQNLVEVFQYRDEGGVYPERAVFAVVNRSMNNTFSYVNNESNGSVWPDGVPPDGVPNKITHGIHLVLVVLFEVMGIAGIVFAISCLIFNIAFRERKVVKLTSPNLNYFIIAGALMLYISVILRSLPGHEDAVNILRCYVGKLISSLGYTVAFGAVLVKMWRVYIIFHNPGAKRRTIQDWKLILIVGGIVAVMVVLLILSYSINLFRPSPTLVTDRERAETINAMRVTELFFVYECGMDNFTSKIFQGVVLMYIIILQVIGIVLAFQTRKIKVKVLNDSKWVAAIIYSSSLCVLVLILSEFALTGFLNIRTALLNIAELTATTIFLALVFVPKMYSLYKDPHGEKVFSTSITTQQATSSAAGERKLSIFPLGNLDDNSKTVIASLQAKVNELERELKSVSKTNGTNSNRNTVSSVDELSVRFDNSLGQN